MFLNNKYKRWYYQIINKARKRGVPNEYHERHHVIPKCMGGKNNFWNIVNLTFREHYIVHWLLTLMVTDKYLNKMLYALQSMSRNVSGGKRVIPSWLYKRAKEAAKVASAGMKLHLGRKFSDEHRRNLSESHKGIRISKETRLKLSRALVGRKKTEETKLKMRNKRPNTSRTMKGRQFSEEHKMNLALAIAR